MEHTYAQALWKAIAGGTEPKKAVRTLHARLVTDGRTNLMHRIGRVFSRIAERELRRSRLVLSVARAKDEARAKKAARDILGKAEAKDMDVHIDESLIGGWRLEGGGQLVDASYKKHLLSIYNRATRN